MNDFYRFASKLVVVLMMASMVAGCSRKQIWTGLGLATVAAVGATAYVYTQGDLEADRPENLSDVFKATRQALTKRGYLVEREELNALDGVIEARGIDPTDSTEKKITVKIKTLESGATHLSIRVGAFGEEKLSREILEDIKRAL